VPVYSLYYVDLEQDSTGASGELSSDPMGFNEFIAAVGDPLYASANFKLKGIKSTSDSINLENFSTMEQWLPGTLWRIRADAISIGSDKSISGGVLCANINPSFTGDLIYGNNVSFYSSYLVCKTFKALRNLSSLTRCFLFGCTAQITYRLYFPRAYSQVASYNSILKINDVGIEAASEEEIDFRNSVVNLNPADFNTAFRERSDNNTNQFGWVAPDIFPDWALGTEEEFNFSKVTIDVSDKPYIGYERGLFWSERSGLGAAGLTNAEPYIDFNSNVQEGSSPFSVAFISNISTTTVVKEITWDFGDGFRSHSNVPTHEYNHGGDFSPMLEVLFEDGTLYKKFKKDFIKVFKVKIIPSAVSGYLPFTVSFSTEADLPKGVTIESYDWDFGDGTPHSSNPTPTHTYYRAATNPVSLKNTFLKS